MGVRNSWARSFENRRSRSKACSTRVSRRFTVASIAASSTGGAEMWSRLSRAAGAIAEICALISSIGSKARVIARRTSHASANANVTATPTTAR